MNNFYVYEIREKISNNIVYIGHSGNLIQRWKTHISSQGNFNNKMHYMNVLENEWIFANRKDAKKYEIDLQKYNGFETETEKRRKQIIHLLSPKNKRGGKKRAQESFKKQCVELECPYCNTKGVGRIMYRWHFHNCKMKNNELVSEE